MTQDEREDEGRNTGHEAGETHNPATRERSDLPFPVVGLGASAGGLVALKQFLELVPEKSGMAFVVNSIATASRKPSAITCCSRCTTCCAIPRSRASIWSVAGTC